MGWGVPIREPQCEMRDSRKGDDDNPPSRIQGGFCHFRRPDESHVVHGVRPEK